MSGHISQKSAEELGLEKISFGLETPSPDEVCNISYPSSRPEVTGRMARAYSPTDNLVEL